MRRSERALVEAARAGSTDAAAELFERHWQAVWQAVYVVSARRELANDVAQDAFVKAVESLDSFDASRPLRPWLVRIAVNRAIDLLRRERRIVALDDVPETASDGEAPDDALTAALGRLSLQRRLIVVLRYWLDFGVDEIADMLAIPPGTVASRLSRALDDLRLDLEADHVRQA